MGRGAQTDVHQLQGCPWKGSDHRLLLQMWMGFRITLQCAPFRGWSSEPAPCPQAALWAVSWPGPVHRGSADTCHGTHGGQGVVSGCTHRNWQNPFTLKASSANH